VHPAIAGESRPIGASPRNAVMGAVLGALALAYVRRRYLQWRQFNRPAAGLEPTGRR